MPNAEDLGFYLEILQLVLLSLLAIRLALTGLWRSYPFFFWYVVLYIPDGIWPLFISIRSWTFLHVWLFTEPVFYIFHVLLVAELCRLILAGHPGIYSLGKWAMSVGVTLALAISILTLIPHIKPHSPLNSQMVSTYNAVQRGLDFGLGIFLLLLLAFLSRYPFRLNRNVLIHSGLYTFFFFTQSLGVFLHALFGLARTDILNTSMTATTCACLVAWLALLSPKGEFVKSVFPTLNPERETRILEQLDALNATLVRAGRRK